MTPAHPAPTLSGMTTTRQTPAGSAAVQGQLWGERARDFATQEPKVIALYEAVLAELSIGPGTWLLDVGCGAGLFLKLAEQRGATVSGLDAAAPLIEIARERIPAAQLVVGEMERLPFPDRSFDVVTGFNAFQLAADPGRALAEAARVGAAGAPVVIAPWGRPEECEAAAYVTELAALLAPPAPGTAGPFALSDAHTLAQFTALGGLTLGPHKEVLCVWDYPDEAALLKALGSTALAVRAIRAVGEAAVTRAILKAVAPFRLSDGGYRLENVFAYTVACASGPRGMTRTSDIHTTRSEGHLMANQAKTLDQPEETRSFENGHVDLVEIAGNKVGRHEPRAGLALVDISQADRRHPQLPGRPRRIRDLRTAPRRDGRRHRDRHPRRRRLRARPGSRRMGRRGRDVSWRRVREPCTLRDSLTDHQPTRGRRAVPPHRDAAPRGRRCARRPAPYVDSVGTDGLYEIVEEYTT
jgi:SAM-dependent methyltransferase